MREFVTAVEDKINGGPPDHEIVYDYEFKLDGRVCRARKAEPEELAVLMADTASRQPFHTQAAGAINFFEAILEPTTRNYLMNRLLDPTDRGFKFPKLQDIVQGMVEDWTGNPTGEPSGSTPPPSSTGSSSTPSGSAPDMIPT